MFVRLPSVLTGTLRCLVLFAYSMLCGAITRLLLTVLVMLLFSQFWWDCDGQQRLIPVPVVAPVIVRALLVLHTVM